MQPIKRFFPNRLTCFPSIRDYLEEIVGDKKPPWRHELHHDAESAFFLLGWWAVHAFPEGGSQIEMTAGIWNYRTGTKDFADSLDEAYSPLEDLLYELGAALQSDLHWATKEPHTHPEFLHEVF